MPESDGTINLRYLDFDADSLFLKSALLNPADRDAMKAHALERLRIPLVPGRTYLQSWIIAMCNENGIPVEFPCTRIGDAAVANSTCSRFIFFLA